MGIEIRARTRRLGQVPMARQCAGRDPKVLGSPCERESGSVKLGLRHNLLIEVSFAEDKKVACGVVVGRGVARNLGAPQFVDVAVAVDADVIRDVDPSVLVLVIPLVLSQMAWGITVVAEDHGLVVESHTGDGVGLSSGAGGSGSPSISAEQLRRRDARGLWGRGCRSR
jgi:hypothetical protein